MNESLEYPHPKGRKTHEYFFWAMAICWTLLLVFSFIWTKHNAASQLTELVRVQARTAYEKDVLYRFWNSTHGSVYVPVSDTTPPNPYLDVPERDITTPQGTSLTLMNPAYMTRQANELGYDRLGIYGHLTSLKPIRPENEPDAWERQALIQFEDGKKEVSEVVAQDNGQVLRLMRPLLVEEACLPCHAKQNYKVGQIRGGISVSINMAPSLKLLNSTYLRLAIGHLLLWLTGIAGLLARSRMLIKRDKERQEAAQKLEQVNSQLEQRVAERTAELKESNRMLKEDIQERMAAEQEKDRLTDQLRQAQKMELIGTMAGGIAHDFNNLLTPILGYAELAQQRQGLSESLGKDLTQISTAAERGKSLVHQILSFSRRSGQNREIVSMQRLINEILELVRPTFPKSITIERELPTNEVYIEADAGQIHQVIMNLCTNAKQAMQERGGSLKLTLETVSAPIANLGEQSLQAEEYACLKVHDSGCGIDQQTKEKLFEPFFTTKKDGEGTGLGLSVVQGIITSHEGAISVESSVGQGSCFQVFLPLVDAESLSSPSVSVRKANGEHVLLVDDEIEIVEMLTEGLVRAGFKVTGCSSSHAALDNFRLQPEAFDLLLTDRVMPGLHGEQLAAVLRDIRPELPVMLITGYEGFEKEGESADAGKYPCLLKPLTPSDVVEEVLQLLKGE